MKRATELFDHIPTWENLLAAHHRARRGKRHRATVEQFELNLERELLRLGEQLAAGSYWPGGFHTFTIRDPKEREIHVAPYRDRVVQQAILGVVEPVFDRRLDDDSYACRRNKGVDAALSRARALSRRSHWVLRTDIRRCFASVPHHNLKTLLRRVFKERRLLALFDRIIDSGGTGSTDGTECDGSRRGLPIGSLISQWLANVYLGEVDTFMRQELRPGGLVRYMDDVALFTDDRRNARTWRGEIALFAQRELGLELNHRVTAIHSTRGGWPFLGFRVFPHQLRLRRANWRRLEKGVRRSVHRFRRGEITEEELAQSVRSRMAHAERGATRGLRRRLIVELGE